MQFLKYIVSSEISYAKKNNANDLSEIKYGIF